MWKWFVLIVIMAALPKKYFNLTAFFYQLGKSGNDFTLKENYRIPYNEDEFSCLKRMQEFIR